MRSRLMTQLGWRPIQKCQKWVKPLEVEARLQKDMGNQGMNHDINSLDMPGLAPSHKIGVPLMLLCNLDTGRGICNETRLHLLKIFYLVLQVSFYWNFKIVSK